MWKPMVKRKASLVAGLALMATNAGWAADEPAGIVKTVTGNARIERGGAAIPILVGTNVLAKDRIVTGSDGSVGITLNDDTRLAAGPNSVLALDGFSFNATTNEGSLSMQVVKGTLRSITGLIAKQSPAAMSVRTPTSTIGVRGTDFIVEVPQ